MLKTEYVTYETWIEIFKHEVKFMLSIIIFMIVESCSTYLAHQLMISIKINIKYEKFDRKLVYFKNFYLGRLK